MTIKSAFEVFVPETKFVKRPGNKIVALLKELPGVLLSTEIEIWARKVAPKNLIPYEVDDLKIEPFHRFDRGMSIMVSLPIAMAELLPLIKSLDLLVVYHFAATVQLSLVEQLTLPPLEKNLLPEYIWGQLTYPGFTVTVDGYSSNKSINFANTETLNLKGSDGVSVPVIVYKVFRLNDEMEKVIVDVVNLAP